MVHQLGGGDVACIVAGAVAGVALLGTCGCCLWRHRHRQQRAPRVSSPPPPTLAHHIMDLDAAAGQQGRKRGFTPAPRSSSAPPALLRPFDSPLPEPVALATTPEPAVTAVAPDGSEEDGEDFIHPGAELSFGKGSRRTKMVKKGKNAAGKEGDLKRYFIPIASSSQSKPSTHEETTNVMPNQDEEQVEEGTGNSSKPSTHESANFARPQFFSILRHCIHLVFEHGESSLRHG